MASNQENFFGLNFALYIYIEALNHWLKVLAEIFFLSRYIHIAIQSFGKCDICCHCLKKVVQYELIVVDFLIFFRVIFFGIEIRWSISKQIISDLSLPLFLFFFLFLSCSSLF